jgi:hypothetical protein
MRTYILISFWIGIVGMVIRVLIMAVREYPYKKTVSLGEEVAGCLLSLGFIIWAGLLLFR